MSMYLSLSLYLSIYICTTVTIPTFMFGGIPRRDKMTNSEKLGHSVILENQIIY